MGSSISAAGIVGFATALIVVVAILIIVALDRIDDISGFSTNSRLGDAHGHLIWAQVLAWIAAGLALILVIGYFMLHAGWLDNEWVHIIFWLGIFGTLIASLILLGVALNDINDANVTDDNTTSAYIWWALGIGIGAIVVLLISGGWRIYANTTADSTDKPATLYQHVSGNFTLPNSMVLNTSPNGTAEIPPQHQVNVTSGNNGTTTTVGMVNQPYTVNTTNTANTNQTYPGYQV